MRALMFFDISAISLKINMTQSVGIKTLPVFRQQLVEESRALPDYVQREFEDYLKVGRLGQGFMRVHCETCHEDNLVAFSCELNDFWVHIRRFSIYSI